MLTIFKVLQLLIIGVLVIFVSDFRKKSGMVPILNEKLTRLLKISYLVPLIIIVYSLVIMDYLSYFDYLGLTINALGTFVAVKAKRDLGICHTWTGYCKDSSTLKASGIYAYIRHPIYTGIYLFVIGGLITLIPHAQWYLTVFIVVIVIFIMSFLAVSASKETNHLSKTLGEGFAKYREQVHAFLPIRKYSE